MSDCGANNERGSRFMEQALPDRLACGMLLATLFFLPLLTAPVTLCAVVTIAIWIISGRCRHDLPLWFRQQWTIPLLLIILIQVVSLCWSSDLASGYKLVERNYVWLLGFAALSITTRVAGSAELAARAFLFGLSGNVLIALMQMAGIISWRNREGSYGLMGYITFSLLLVVGMLLLSRYYQRTPHTGTRIVVATTLGAFFLTLLLLPGRGGYLSFMAALPIMLCCLVGRKRVLMMALLAALPTAALLLSPTVRDRIAVIPHQMAAYDPHRDQNLNTPVSERLHMWYGAAELIKEHPLIGIGTGSYKKEMERFKNRIQGNTGGFSHPHNSYLYVAVSYGLVGILLYGRLLYLLLSSSFRHRHTVGGFMAFSVLSIILVGSLTDTQILSNATGILLGIAPGLIPVPGATDEG